MTDSFRRTSPGRLETALAGRYRIERELGAGGMATVYLAEDVRHHRKVALKVLHPELSSVLGPERFLKEIELTASLQHPHILPLFDGGSAEGQLFYVRPLIEGESLRRKLQREGRLDIEEAVRIVRGIGERDVVRAQLEPRAVVGFGPPRAPVPEPPASRGARLTVERVRMN